MKLEIFVTALLGLFCCTQATASAQEVLEIDGGFENGPTSGYGIFGKWKVVGNAKQSVPMSTTEVHGGTQSLLLTLSPEDKLHGHSGVELRLDPNLLAPGDVLEFSAFAFLKDQLPPAARVSLSLSFGTPDWKPKASVELKVPNTTGEWHEISDTVTVPPEFDPSWIVNIKAIVVWNNSLPSFPVEVYVDDMSLTIRRDRAK